MSLHPPAPFPTQNKVSKIKLVIKQTKIRKEKRKDKRRVGDKKVPPFEHVAEYASQEEVYA